MGGVYQERNYYEVGFWLKKIRKHIRWYGNFPHCWKTHLTLIMYIGANNTTDNTINAMFFDEFHSIISCCNWIWPHFHISWLDCWEETKIMFCLQLQDNNIFFPVSVHSDLSHPPPTVAHACPRLLTPSLECIIYFEYIVYARPASIQIQNGGYVNL